MDPLKGWDCSARSSPFAPWFYDLVSRGITAGCGGGKYCTQQPATRGQMAVFLSVTFGL